MNYPQMSTADLGKITFVGGAHVNFGLAWEFTRMRVRFFTSDGRNTQICENLLLRGRQEVTDDESQGLDRQFFCGVELNDSSGSDDLGKISDRRFRSMDGLHDTSSGSSGSKGWVCFIFKCEGESFTFIPAPETLSASAQGEMSYRAVRIQPGPSGVPSLSLPTAAIAWRRLGIGRAADGSDPVPLTAESKPRLLLRG